MTNAGPKPALRTSPKRKLPTPEAGEQRKHVEPHRLAAAFRIETDDDSSEQRLRHVVTKRQRCHHVRAPNEQSEVSCQILEYKLWRTCSGSHRALAYRLHLSPCEDGEIQPKRVRGRRPAS